MSKKISTAEQIKQDTKRKINKNLWAKVSKLSIGTIENKISAVNIIFKDHYKLPEKCIQIAKELADKRQPLKVRVQIAKNMIKYTSIPVGMYRPLFRILQEDKNQKIIKILTKTPLFEFAKNFQYSIFNNTMLNFLPTFLESIKNFYNVIDWEHFKKSHRISMVKILGNVKDDRTTAILGQILAEFWLDVFIKNIFHNSKEILDFGFDKKRKILFGLKVLKSTTNNDLKKLDDIRGEYAHNFVADPKKVLGHLEKMDCYKNMKFGKNSKNNNRIKKCTIKLVSDMMDLEERFIIDVKKKEKPKTN